MHINTKRLFSNSAFTLVEIMIVVAIIGLLAAIAIPNFRLARQQSFRNVCINNMKQLVGAKATWAVEHKKALLDIPTQADLVGPQLYLRDMLVCPAGGTYTIGLVGAPPACSIAGHTL